MVLGVFTSIFWVCVPVCVMCVYQCVLGVCTSVWRVSVR